MPNGVLVIGGGIAGITAALDLAEKGYGVHLLEKTPSIGGRMAQLDKTFPTLDCAICILAPKMVEISRHPNIQLYTYSEVSHVQPKDDGKSFKVRIKRKPRYVNEEKCTGCLTCTEKCPVKVPSEFEEKLGQRKAIYIPFPQAVPAVAVIDRTYCLYFQKGVCKLCEKFCPAKAIDFDQEEYEETLEVASIILATGFDLIDPAILSQYGYGQLPNVMTSLEFERLLNAAGPTGGKIVRLSDKTAPEKIAFVQCVGSRNVDVKPYCSQICCMYATKEAIVSKEHNPKIDVTIFYNDLQVGGKAHQELVRRAAEEFQIKYVKGLPSGIDYDFETNKLVIRHADIVKDKPRTESVDLVVLCPSVVPRKDSSKLARMLGISMTEFGFFKSVHSSSAVDTNVPGIYVCGVCEGPKDISHSVAQASAAATRAALHAELIKSEPRRIAPVQKYAGGEPRIGVFVCNCGINIGAVVDVPKVVEFARNLDAVVYSEEFLFACSKDAIEKIKEAIKEHNLNRVIVASCTPRTHEPLFRATCEEAGLNPYLFEMVNIREHDSWVHPHQPKEATRKAMELVQMAVAKAKLLSPLEQFEIDVCKSALIIGGGVAGLIAAKEVAEKSFKAYVVHSKEKLGGKYTIPFEDVAIDALLNPLIKSIEEHPNIEVFTSAYIKDVKGALGNFDVTIVQNETPKTLRVGAIIVAEEAETLQPQDLFGYGRYDNVITLHELQRLIQQNKLVNEKAIALILCAGAREKSGRTYCSRVCCSEAIDSALKIKEQSPEAEIFVFYRDMVLPIEGAHFYRKAREQGVTFIRYLEEKPPRVISVKKGLEIEAEDLIAGIKLSIPMDKVVLVTPLVPSENNRALSSSLKVPLNTQGFFLEAHPKLRPLDFATDGIFICGTGHSPQSVVESVYQALGAASRALIPLTRGKVLSEAITAEVNEDRCIACANCERVCEYNAINVEKSVAKVNPFLCKGCGVCAVECPAMAITMNHYTSDQISSMIKASLQTLPEGDKPKALAFFCNWCSYAAADMAGVSRFEYPPAVRIIRVMCSGRVDETHVLQAFLLGVDGVLIGGCHPGDCHYISGNLKAEKRVKQMKRWLREAGIEPERLRLEWASAGEGQHLAAVLKEFTEQLEKLGPNPLKKSAGKELLQN